MSETLHGPGVCIINLLRGEMESKLGPRAPCVIFDAQTPLSPTPTISPSLAATSRSPPGRVSLFRAEEPLNHPLEEALGLLRFPGKRPILPRSLDDSQPYLVVLVLAHQALQPPPTGGEHGSGEVLGAV